MENGTNGWSRDTALWVIAAVIVIAFIAYIWNKGCSEKTMFATGLATLNGKISAIEPAVTAQGNNIYKLNGVVASTVQGVADVKECYGADLYELNHAVFYGGRSRGCGSCGNREFKQTSTYNLASTNVTVDETCRN